MAGKSQKATVRCSGVPLATKRQHSRQCSLTPGGHRTFQQCGGSLASGAPLTLKICDWMSATSVLHTAHPLWWHKMAAHTSCGLVSWSIPASLVSREVSWLHRLHRRIRHQTSYQTNIYHFTFAGHINITLYPVYYNQTSNTTHLPYSCIIHNTHSTCRITLVD